MTLLLESSPPPPRPKTPLQYLWGFLRTLGSLAFDFVGGMVGKWLMAVLLLLAVALIAIIVVLPFHLTGNALLTGRDDYEKNGFFAAECIHTNLSGPHRFVRIFNERAPRDAYSCPWVRKIEQRKPGIVKTE